MNLNTISLPLVDKPNTNVPNLVVNINLADQTLLQEGKTMRKMESENGETKGYIYVLIFNYYVPNV
jgi:hypothetical protein